MKRGFFPALLMIQAFLVFSQDNSAARFKDVTNTHLNTFGLDNNTMDGAVADIDNDGDPDLILAIEYQENIILINDGTGKFSNESNARFPQLRHDSEDIAVADFDQDGDLDIVFVSEDDQVNEYYENIGKGYFKDVGYRIPVKGTTNAVEAADFDNDGDIDLVLGNSGQNYFLLNDGKGNFSDETKNHLPVITSTTQDIDVADIDGDGDLDLIMANESVNYLLINDGKGVFSLESKRLPTVDDQTREADFGDIDNDGDLDLVFANVDFGGIGNPQNRLLINDGNGFFSEITSWALPKSTLRTVDMDFVDINQDGHLDLISGNRWNGVKQLILINDGMSSFADQTILFLPELNIYAFDFQVADFNQDGIADIYICAFRGQDKLLFGIK